MPAGGGEGPAWPGSKAIDVPNVGAKKGYFSVTEGGAKKKQFNKLRIFSSPVRPPVLQWRSYGNDREAAKSARIVSGIPAEFGFEC